MNQVLATIPVSNGRRLRVIDSKVERENHLQQSLFDKRTADPSEKDSWMSDTMEIVLTRNEWWPSQLYAVLAVQPYHPSWWGALWSKAQSYGYKKVWSDHRSSPTKSANNRTEFLRRRV